MPRIRAGALAGYVTILLLAGFIVSYFFLTAPQRRMQRLLKRLADVEVGTTTIAEWRGRMHADKLDSALLTCGGGNCTFSQKIKISTVSRLRLASPSAIAVSIAFQDGVASEIYVWFEVDDQEVDDQKAGKVREPGTGATIHETQQSRSCLQHYCAYVNDRSGYPWAVIEMDSGAPKEDRTKAFAVNVGCLTKIGGCKSVKSILPQVFGKS